MSNFTTVEIYFLLECVEQKASSIENKRTDSVYAGAKKKTWKDIAEMFSSNPNCRARTEKQLEEKWKNL
uniref:Regulatory protein zeste n=1 Tax=Romanomermis culicivorax TaxID=13658 RepID=A0A915L2I2_ROMCU